MATFTTHATTMPSPASQTLDPRTVPDADRPSVYGWPNSENGYTIKEQPSGTTRRMKIIVIGAGASGINFAKFQQDKLKDVETVIYEKNPDVGGTWFENRYPGCACDIPSVTYQFSWEPAVWSKYYSNAEEIRQYFKTIVDKYGLMKYMKLQHRVTKGQWDDERGKWVVSLENLFDGTTLHDEGDVIVNCGGFLNFWEWPDLKNSDSFKGILAHSADFPKDVSLKGKTVAIVGSGSTGTQLLAAVQSEASHVYTWLRSPIWITSSYASEHASPEGGNFEYSEDQKKKFSEDPTYYLKYRKDVEMSMSDFFLIHKNTPSNQRFTELAKADMLAKLKGKQEIAELIIPKAFPAGCRRPIPGSGYLEALAADNVTVYKRAGLKELTPNGFLDPEGNEVQVDVIVLCTGFTTTWVSPFPIVARGHNLQDVYRERPLSYFGVAAKHMPNYFTHYGPYGPLGQQSALVMMEYFSRYVIQVVQKMQVEDIKSMTPKAKIIDDYGDHADLWMKRTVWDGPCAVWWKGGSSDGKPTIFPGTRATFMTLLEKPRYEDYEIEYLGKNAWAWLGNGFCTRDTDGRDLTWFMGLIDNEDKQRKYDVLVER